MGHQGASTVCVGVAWRKARTISNSHTKVHREILINDCEVMGGEIVTIRTVWTRADANTQPVCPDPKPSKGAQPRRAVRNHANRKYIEDVRGYLRDHYFILIASTSRLKSGPSSPLHTFGYHTPKHYTLIETKSQVFLQKACNGRTPSPLNFHYKGRETQTTLNHKPQRGERCIETPIRNERITKKGCIKNLRRELRGALMRAFLVSCQWYWFPPAKQGFHIHADYSARNNEKTQNVLDKHPRMCKN